MDIISDWKLWATIGFSFFALYFIPKRWYDFIKMIKTGDKSKIKDWDNSDIIWLVASPFLYIFYIAFILILLGYEEYASSFWVFITTGES